MTLEGKESKESLDLESILGIGTKRGPGEDRISWADVSVCILVKEEAAKAKSVRPWSRVVRHLAGWQKGLMKVLATGSGKVGTKGRR